MAFEYISIHFAWLQAKHIEEVCKAGENINKTTEEKIIQKMENALKNREEYYKALQERLKEHVRIWCQFQNNEAYVVEDHRINIKLQKIILPPQHSFAWFDLQNIICSLFLDNSIRLKCISSKKKNTHTHNASKKYSSSIFLSCIEKKRL